MIHALIPLIWKLQKRPKHANYEVCRKHAGLFESQMKIGMIRKQGQNTLPIWKPPHTECVCVAFIELYTEPQTRTPHIHIFIYKISVRSILHTCFGVSVCVCCVFVCEFILNLVRPLSLYDSKWFMTHCSTKWNFSTRTDAGDRVLEPEFVFPPFYPSLFLLSVNFRTWTEAHIQTKNI